MLKCISWIKHINKWHRQRIIAVYIHTQCIWHVGTTQDPGTTIYSPCDECGSQRNHQMPSSLPSGHWEMFAALGTHCPLQWSGGLPPEWKRPLGRPSHTWLRAVKADLSQVKPTEHWHCICLEEGSYSWRLAAHCEHSNAPAEYAIKEEDIYTQCSGKRTPYNYSPTSSVFYDLWRRSSPASCNTIAFKWLHQS